MIAAKNFNAATANINQLRYANLDYDWHLADPATITDVNAFEKQAIARYALLPMVEGTNTSCAFAHIFAGGYAAGYYSYKWAEALEADAWSMFAENGIFDQATAKNSENTSFPAGTPSIPRNCLRLSGDVPWIPPHCSNVMV